jgi:hypothetical protein
MKEHVKSSYAWLVEQTSCDGARVLSLMSCDVMST